MSELRVALVGGPSYDPMYACLPEFERQTGHKVKVVAALSHPELNAHVEQVYSQGKGDYDLISTHSKYAPSQKPWLRPLDGLISAQVLTGFAPGILALDRVDDQLLQLPRNLDVKLLFYRRDWFEDPKEQAAFATRYGYPLQPPETWPQLLDIAEFFTRPPAMYGYVFPGRYSGLFGHFYDLLGAAGGELFDADLRPIFDGPAGEWALRILWELHSGRRTTPPQLPEWHYEEVSALFRNGGCAMVADWPGYYALYVDPACPVAGRFGIGKMPAGPGGKRAAYGGSHGFAIPTSVRDLAGATALLEFLTSEAVQAREAQRGEIPVRPAIMAQVLAGCAPDSLAGLRYRLLAEVAERDILIPPKFAEYPSVEDALWTSLIRAITGEISVRAALELATQQVREILSDRRV